LFEGRSSESRTAEKFIDPLPAGGVEAGEGVETLEGVIVEGLGRPPPGVVGAAQGVGDLGKA